MSNLPDYLQNPWFLSFLFLTAACSTALLTPVVIRFARRKGVLDRGGYRRLYRGEIPLLGGWGIAIPLAAIYVVLARAGFLIVKNWEWIYRVHRAWLSPLMSLAAEREVFSYSFLVLTIGGVAIVALGTLDDIWGLRARVKLLGQIAVAVFVCASGLVLPGIYIPLIGGVALGPTAGFIISVLWIVGLINAFNLIDGLDGLAAGIGLIAAVALAVLGTIAGNTIIVLACLPLAGSLLAFLFFNFHSARIFLGDTGSMFIGYVLATITLMGAYKTETAVILLAPMLALSFPIFETLISMIRRFIRGVPIFAGDRHHTHHRLLSKGLSQRQVVLILYGVTLLLAVAAVMSQLIPKGSRGDWVPGSVFAVTLIGIAWWAGYLRPSSFRKVFRRRGRNTLLSAFARYAVQSMTSSTKATTPNEIMRLCRREMGLSFLEAWFEAGPFRIGSSGTPGRGSTGTGDFDPTERLRVTSVSGHSIIIRYQFVRTPGENERRDVAACLASIFEQGGVNLLLEKAVSMRKGMDETTPPEGPHLPEDFAFESPPYPDETKRHH